MVALDQFVLWVNGKLPYQTVADYTAALKTAGAGPMRMGGTGSKQEDQIITAAIEQATGAKLTYTPYKGGGDVAAQLVGGHVDSSVNNPIEAVAQWRAGELRPLCAFETARMPYKEPVAAGKSWADIPTCREAGGRDHHPGPRPAALAADDPAARSPDRDPRRGPDRQRLLSGGPAPASPPPP